MVTDHNVIARPYAKAAFDYAVQTHTSDEWAQSLAVLAECIDSQPINSALRAPEQTPETTSQVLLDLTKGCLSEAVQRFVRLLAKNKRLWVLPQINALFDQLLQMSQNACQIQVITPFELNKTQQEAIIAELKHHFSKTIHICYQIDRQLLGGMIIKAGDKVIDASLAGQLKQLTATLLAPKAKLIHGP